jgi:hypothetical protein
MCPASSLAAEPRRRLRVAVCDPGRCHTCGLAKATRGVHHLMVCAEGKLIGPLRILRMAVTVSSTDASCTATL